MGCTRYVRKSEDGQSTVEFALTLPLFLAVMIGLVGFSMLFYSYVTMQLAAREGTSSIVHNPKQTYAQVETYVRSKSFSLDPSQMTVSIEPSDPTVWLSRTKVSVSIVYVVPLPRVTIPNLSGGAGFPLLGPIPVTAVSKMTIE